MHRINLALAVAVLAVAGCLSGQDNQPEPNAVPRHGQELLGPAEGWFVGILEAPYLLGPGEKVTFAVRITQGDNRVEVDWTGYTVVWTLTDGDGAIVHRAAGWTADFVLPTWGIYRADVEVFRPDGVRVGAANSVAVALHYQTGGGPCPRGVQQAACPPFAFVVPKADTEITLTTSLLPPMNDIPTWKNLRVEVRDPTGSLAASRSAERGLIQLMPISTVGRPHEGNWTVQWVSDTPIEGFGHYAVWSPARKEPAAQDFTDIDLNDWPPTVRNEMYVGRNGLLHWYTTSEGIRQFSDPVLPIGCTNPDFVTPEDWRSTRLAIEQAGRVLWDATVPSDAEFCDWQVPIGLEAIARVGRYDFVTSSGNPAESVRTSIGIREVRSLNNTCEPVPGTPCTLTTFDVPAGSRITGMVGVVFNGGQPAELFELVDATGTVVARQAMVRPEGFGQWRFALPPVSGEQSGAWTIRWHHAGTIDNRYWVELLIEP